MDYSREYLTIEALESGLIIINSNTNNIWYRKTGESWIQSPIENSATFKHTIEVNEGDKLQIKAIMPEASIQDGTNIELDYVKFTFKNTTIRFNVLGNISSLFFDLSNIETDATVLNSEFITEKKNSSLVGGYGMFANTYVQNAHNLVIESYQYVGCQKMFANCIELTAGPDITITAYNGFQYTNMFIGCYSLASDDQINITRYDDIIALLAADITTRMTTLEEQFAYYSTTTDEKLKYSYNSIISINNTVDSYNTSTAEKLDAAYSYAYSNVAILSTNILSIQNDITEKYTYINNRIDTNTNNDSSSYAYLLSRIASLENSISTSETGDITVSEYDDTELRELILQLQTNNNSSYAKAISRIEVLEAKPDIDTIYDDSDIQSRLSYIETKYNANKLYDASSINTSISNSLNQINMLNSYVTSSYAYSLQKIEDTYAYTIDSYNYLLDTINEINNMSYVTTDLLSSCSYITLSDIPDVDLTSFATTEYVDNQLSGLSNYDDTDVNVRLTNLESSYISTSSYINNLNSYVINSYAYLVGKIYDDTEVKSYISSINGRLTSIDSSIESIDSSIESIDSSLEEITTITTTMTDDISDKDARIAELEQTILDLKNKCRITFRIKREDEDSFYIYPVDVYATNSTEVISSVYLKSSSTYQVDDSYIYVTTGIDYCGDNSFTPYVIVNNEIIELNENHIGEYIVNKGETAHMIIVADGYALIEKTEQYFSDATETFTLEKSTDTYIVVVPNAKDTTVNISLGANTYQSQYYKYYPSLDYEVSILAYADDNGINQSQFTLTKNDSKSIIGYKTYSKVENLCLNENQESPNDYTIYAYREETYKHIIVPINLDAGYSTTQYTVTIGSCIPSTIKLKYHRGWQDKANVFNETFIGDTIQVLDGEKFTLCGSTDYIDGQNFYDTSTSNIITTNKTISLILSPATYCAYKLHACNVDEAKCNMNELYDYNTEIANAGDEYILYKMVTESLFENSTQVTDDLLLTAAGYKPYFKHLVYLENLHNTIITPVLESMPESFLDVYIRKYDSTNTKVNYELLVDDNSPTITVYTHHCKKIFAGDVEGWDVQSAVGFAVFSSSQYSISVHPYTPTASWLISNPKFGYGYETEEYFYRQNDYVNISCTSGVSSEGYIGYVYITNEDGLSKRILIWTHKFNS